MYICPNNNINNNNSSQTYKNDGNNRNKKPIIQLNSSLPCNGMLVPTVEMSV